MPNNRSIDAGRLNEPVEILALRETEPTVWAYVPAGRAWAANTLSEGRNLFSQVGVGARDAAVVLRRVPLTLGRVLRWRGGVLWPTSIVPMGRGHLEVHAAVVRVCRCRATRTENTLGEGNRAVPKTVMEVSFPGVLTERYSRYAREETHAEVETGYVLVTGKPIRLEPGDLVAVLDGTAPGTYAVEAVHILDEHKNEYEMSRRGDV